MKLGQVTKLDTRETRQRQKKIDVDDMLTNCETIVIFPIFGQFGAIRKPDSRHIVCKTYIYINSNFLSYKNLKQN